MGNKKALKKRKWNIPVLTTVIGVVGTIIVALISVWGNRQSVIRPIVETRVVTATFIPTVVPTDTVPPGEPTSTPAPTDTPTLTPTEVQPVEIGQDWNEGCISSLWKPYPSTLTVVDTGNGCLQEPVHVFAADNGALAFLGQRTGAGPVADYGMFAPLPESGSVTFTARLVDLSNVDLWVGVFPEPDIRSGGLLLTVPAGNVKKRVIVQKETFTYETILSTQNLDQGNGFSFTFTYNNVSATGNVDPFVLRTYPFSMPVSNKWLYIGYRGLSGSYRIEGSFFNFTLR